MACRLATTAESSAPLTWMFSVAGTLLLTPAHRASSATEPAAWMTHSGFLPPAAAIFSPAVSPARFSSEPKYISAPSSLYWSMPELKPTSGIPASVADFTAPARASGVTRVVAMPSTLESTAVWISCACLSAAGSLEYCSFDPVSLAACSAPARILSQKESPGVSWVTMAMV